MKTVLTEDVNEYSDDQQLAFHTNILMHFMDLKFTLFSYLQYFKLYSCIDIYVHSCLKPFLIGRKPCSNRKTHVQIMKFTGCLNMGFCRRHWAK